MSTVLIPTATDNVTLRYPDASGTLATMQNTDSKKTVRVKTTDILSTAATTSGFGEGKTITNAGTQTALVIDGVTMAVNDRVLVDTLGTNGVTGLTTASNGIYTVTTVGSGSTNWRLTRAHDADGSLAGPVSSGMHVFVSEGGVNAGRGYLLTTPNPITVDTTTQTFVVYTVATTTPILTFSYGYDNVTANTTYTPLCTFIYPGSNLFTLSTMYVMAFMDSGPTSYDIRVYDVTNSQTIATTNSANLSTLVIAMTGLTNINASPAIWEVQMRRVGGSPTNNIYLVGAHVSGAIGQTNGLNFSFNKSTTNTSYTAIGALLYPGSASTPITAAYIDAFMDSGATSYDVRLQDITTNLTVASVTTQTNTTDAIINMGTLSNLSTSLTVLEIQAKRNGGSSTDNIFVRSLRLV